MDKQRLQRQKEELEAQWDLLTARLTHLKRAKILETRPDENFRLEQEIDTIETERQQVEKDLNKLEAKLLSDKENVSPSLVETEEKQEIVIEGASGHEVVEVKRKTGEIGGSKKRIAISMISLSIVWFIEQLIYYYIHYQGYADGEFDFYVIKKVTLWIILVVTGPVVLRWAKILSRWWQIVIALIVSIGWFIGYAFLLQRTHFGGYIINSGIFVVGGVIIFTFLSAIYSRK